MTSKVECTGTKREKLPATKHHNGQKRMIKPNKESANPVKKRKPGPSSVIQITNKTFTKGFVRVIKKLISKSTNKLLNKIESQ